jgi:hypothetical protein
VNDIYKSLSVLGIEPDAEHVCAVIAVTEQESGFRVNPVIPGLGTMAWHEIDDRAHHAGIPASLLHVTLEMTSPDGHTWSYRIDHARTEKDLSDVFEDFTGQVPLGRKLFAGWNPIRTRGPMQVNVAYAQQFVNVRSYPYPVKDNLADELFTRRGSLYFGTAHLFAYSAPYDNRYLYRFADYNAGQYASRNAAFQHAVSVASGTALDPDGALLPHDASAKGAGSTEAALHAIAHKLDMSPDDIHDALEQGRTAEFEKTALYRKVFALADHTSGHTLPRALVPHIELHSSKISRKLTTEWYAHRVDGRYQRCLKAAGD